MEAVPEIIRQQVGLTGISYWILGNNLVGNVYFGYRTISRAVWSLSCLTLNLLVLMQLGQGILSHCIWAEMIYPCSANRWGLKPVWNVMHARPVAWSRWRPAKLGKPCRLARRRWRPLTWGIKQTRPNSLLELDRLFLSPVYMYGQTISCTNVLNSSRGIAGDFEALAIKRSLDSLSLWTYCKPCQDASPACLEIQTL
jgi:hypothetical protein